MRNSNEKPFSDLVGAFRVTKYKVKRAKFESGRREEVKAVREQRACLRCSLLKLKCSYDDLCTTCAKLVSGHQRQTLSFSDCIRTRLSEVSLFGLYLPSNDKCKVLATESERMALSRISLTFAENLNWDLDTLVKDTLEWLNDPSFPKLNRVGALSSPRFLSLLKAFSGKLVDPSFQRMLYAMSLAYSRPVNPPSTIEKIHEIGCVSGHEFLKILDQWLKPQSLQQCSQDEFQALFLMVFGTIVAISYCDLSFDQPARERKGNARDMQSHICRILAHYMMYLGSKLRLPITRRVNQFVHEGAASEWHEPGVFDWNSMEYEDEWQVWQTAVEDWVLVHSVIGNRSMDTIDSAVVQPRQECFSNLYESNQNPADIRSHLSADISPAIQPDLDLLLNANLKSFASRQGIPPAHIVKSDIQQSLDLYHGFAPSSQQNIDFAAGKKSLPGELEPRIGRERVTVTRLCCASRSCGAAVRETCLTYHKRKECKYLSCPWHGCTAVFQIRQDVLKHLEVVHFPSLPQFGKIGWNISQPI